MCICRWSKQPVPRPRTHPDHRADPGYPSQHGAAEEDCALSALDPRFTPLTWPMAHPACAELVNHRRQAFLQKPAGKEHRAHGGLRSMKESTCGSGEPQACPDLDSHGYRLREKRWRKPPWVSVVPTDQNSREAHDPTAGQKHRSLVKEHASCRGKKAPDPLRITSRNDGHHLDQTRFAHVPELGRRPNDSRDGDPSSSPWTDLADVIHGGPIDHCAEDEQRRPADQGHRPETHPLASRQIPAAACGALLLPWSKPSHGDQ